MVLGGRQVDFVFWVLFLLTKLLFRTVFIITWIRFIFNIFRVVCLRGIECVFWLFAVVGGGSLGDTASA